MKQVADQLVQFRSLTDMVSVKRTLGGALSVFGRRRVFRGIPRREGTSRVVLPGDSLGLVPGPVEVQASGLAGCAPGTSAAAEVPSLLADGVAPFPTVSVHAAETGHASTGDDVSIPRTAARQIHAHARVPQVETRRLEESSASIGPETGGGDPGRGDPSASKPGGVERGLGLEEDLDEHVEHLVLVIHGIGDALMSMDLGVVQLKSLVECCDTLRSHHEEVCGVCARWPRSCVRQGCSALLRPPGFSCILPPTAFPPVRAPCSRRLLTGGRLRGRLILQAAPTENRFVGSSRLGWFSTESREYTQPCPPSLDCHRQQPSEPVLPPLF